MTSGSPQTTSDDHATSPSPTTTPRPTGTPPRWPSEIELRWQDRWDAEGTFEAPNPAGPLADPEGVAGRGPKLFILDMFPYPSGTGLHVGHPLGFTGTDVYARYQRMAGRNVLYTMGFDAFGLPAEQFAVQTGTHPAITTAENIVDLPPPDPPAGAEPRPAPLDRHDRPALLPLDAVDLPQIFESWYDPEAVRPDGGVGRARPIGELRAELDAGTRDARRRSHWSALSPCRAGRRHRRVPPGLRRRRPGQLVPGPRHGRRQRGGHRRRPQRPRQLPGVQAQHAPVDDAHHGLRRPADRRPRRAGVDRLAEDDAAQLDRPLATAPASTSPARPGRSRCSRPARTRCSGPRSWSSRPEHPLVAGPDGAATRPSPCCRTGGRPTARKDVDRQDEDRAEDRACSPAATPPTR